MRTSIPFPYGMAHGTGFPRVRAVTILACLLLIPSPAASGATIKGVSAPTNVLRPNDNTLYPFDYTITFTYSRNEVIDATPVTIAAQYWQDEGVDDEIDLGTITIPAPAPGTSPNETERSQKYTFNVGCDLEGVIFGPSGSTGDFTMNNQGLFVFDAVQGNWGHNSVICGAATPASSAASEMTLIPEPTTGLLALPLIAAARCRPRRVRRETRNKKSEPVFAYSSGSRLAPYQGL